MPGLCILSDNPKNIFRGSKAFKTGVIHNISMLQRADMVKPEIDSWDYICLFHSSLNISYLNIICSLFFQVGGLLHPTPRCGIFLSSPQLPSLPGHSATMWWEPAALGKGIYRHSGNEASYWICFGFEFKLSQTLYF